jgi:hypothetical protein
MEVSERVGFIPGLQFILFWRRLFGETLSAFATIATILLQENTKQKMMAPPKIVVSAFRDLTSVEPAAPEL